MSNNMLRSRQLNPCDHYFWKSRGYSERPHNWKALLDDMGYYDEDSYSESEEEDYEDTASVDNNNARDSLRSRQLDPSNDLFWKCRGYTGRPHNWQDLLDNMGYYDEDSDCESEEDSQCESEEASDYESEDDCVNTPSVSSKDNLRSRQLNPCDHLFWKCRGYPERPHNWKDLLENMGYYDDNDCKSKGDSVDTPSVKPNDTLRSRQLNPCDHLFWKCRGYTERPHNWKDLLEDMGCNDDDDDDSDSAFCDGSTSSCAPPSQQNANNPNHNDFWRQRGWPSRPDDWRERYNAYCQNK